MKPWESRPEEVANLLNPAFCGRVIHQCVQAHIDETQNAMPYALAFLVLPLALHPEAQATMRGNIRHFQSWIGANQHIKIGLSGRARALVPYTREALTFLNQVGILKIGEGDASLTIAGSLRRRRVGMLPVGVDTKTSMDKAATLGRWFARLNSPRTIYASLGLMP